MHENPLPADAVQPEIERELPDHRKIGRALGLFHQQDDAAGSVFWHPNGFTLYRVIEGYIRDRLRREGYDEIRTPQLYDRSLFVASGHWENYRKDMFRCSSADETVESREFALKPMNCPGHVQIFNAQTVTYRQLPMRLSEFGCCHRNEASGALNGLMRVRQFTQDDAHIFCTPDQVLAETKAFCALVMSVYEDFGFTNVEIGFSTRPEKRAGSDETWDRAEAALAAAVTEAGYGYTIQPGEGAFYGPKLEFTLTDARGRSWQCGTLQLDFVLPESLDATYESAHDGKQRPVMLHRAILGSFERFIAILLEETDGRLPPWLSPVQFVVLPIKPEHAEYAERVVHALRAAGIRGKVDARDENLKQRIKEHSVARVPFVLVVGGREAEQQTVAVRDQSGTSTTMTIPGAAGILFRDCHRPTLVDCSL